MHTENVVSVFVHYDFNETIIYIARINTHSIAFSSRGVVIFTDTYIIACFNSFCFSKTYATDFRVGEGNLWQCIIACPTEIFFVFSKV